MAKVLTFSKPKLFVVEIEDTKLVHRSDLMNWLCSSEIRKGKSTDRYWVVATDTSIYNTYGDPDVNYLIAMLQRAQIAGYESLMIMKENVNRREDQPTSELQGSTGQGEVQQNDSPKTGEVSGGEPNDEIPTSTESAENSGEQRNSSKSY